MKLLTDRCRRRSRFSLCNHKSCQFLFLSFSRFLRSRLLCLANATFSCHYHLSFLPTFSSSCSFAILLSHLSMACNQQTGLWASTINFNVNHSFFLLLFSFVIVIVVVQLLFPSSCSHTHNKQLNWSNGETCVLISWSERWKFVRIRLFERSFNSITAHGRITASQSPSLPSWNWFAS